MFQAIADLAGGTAGLITEAILSFAGRFFRVPESRWLRFIVGGVAYFVIVIPLSIFLFIAFLYLLAAALGIKFSLG
jgi:hypothetical protein